MTISNPIAIKPNISSPDEIAETRTQKTENLWQNPSPATEAMKKAIEQVKNKFTIDQQWDGDFYL